MYIPVLYLSIRVKIILVYRTNTVKGGEGGGAEVVQEMSVSDCIF